MLTDKEMTEDDFSAWKHASSWFFEALKERQEYHRQQADQLLAQFAFAPYSFTDAQKQALLSHTQRGEMLADICAIKHEEVVEVENDTDG